MKVIKLRIFQPSAHYRVPFTLRRKHTYPIPPYSTVVGLMCNVLGIKDQNDGAFEVLKRGLSLAIYGKYDYLNREYVWFRNLEKGAHKSRFGSPSNRAIDQIPEHPGGQIPVTIDILENVRLLIYIKHSDSSFLSELFDALQNPVRRVSPLHLGRAEDLIAVEGIELREIEIELKPLYGRMRDYDFTWLVDPYRGERFFDEELYPQDLRNAYFEEYKNFFYKVQGSYHLVTSFYKIVKGQRNFEYVPAKLFEGGDFPLNFGKPFKFPFDGDMPLFFAKLSGGG